MSDAETLLAVQLEQAGIEHVREVRFVEGRKFRADFMVKPQSPYFMPILVEVEGGTWTGGRHSRGSGFASDTEKQYLAVKQGYRYLRVTTGQVENGTALKWIQDLLEGRAA